MASNEIRKIIYATDMGEHTRPAFHRALNLALTYDAQLICLHVVERINPSHMAVVGLYYPGGQLTDIDPRDFDAIQTRVQDRMHSMLAAEAKDQGVALAEPQCLVTKGDPAKMIMATAKEHSADLIVLGSHSYNALERVLLGSVANEVVNHSKTPVLLVPIGESV
jgi:nucleotide-binding universal stress UspA family protein